MGASRQAERLLEPEGTFPAHRMRSATERQLRALRAQQRTNDADHAGALGLLRQLADALDHAGRIEQLYAIPQLAARYMEALGMVLASNEPSELDQLLAELSADAPAAAVRDTPPS